MEVGGGQDAPGHGDQVGHEGQPHRAAGRRVELLDHLGLVAVAVHPVGLDRFVHLREVETEGRRTSPPAHPALGVDHHLGLHQTLAERGEGADQAGGRVAARDGQQVGGGDGLAVKFDQGVHRLLAEVWGGMLEPVPARVGGGIGEAEVGAHVDHHAAGVEPLPGVGGGHRVRQGGEHHLGVADVHPALDLEADPAPRDGGGEGLAGRAPAEQSRELDAGMPVQELDALGADVAGGAADGGADHGGGHGRGIIRVRCMFMQQRSSGLPPRPRASGRPRRCRRHRAAPPR